MRRWRLRALVAALAATVAGCGDSAPPGPTPSPPVTDTRGWLAWVTATDVAVRRADGSVEKAAALPARATAGSLAWSDDGLRLAWIEWSGERGALAVYDVASRAVTRAAPAAMPRQVFAFGRGFAGIDDKGRLHAYSPATAGSSPGVSRVDTTLPEAEDPFGAPSVVGSLGDRLVVVVSPPDASSYGGPTDVYTVTASGAATKVFSGGGEDNLPVSHLTATATRERVSYVTGTTAGRCVETVPRIETREASTWRVVPGARLPAPAPGHEWRVVTTDYGASGTLAVVLDAVRAGCAATQPTPEVWTSRGGPWSRVWRGATWAAYGPSGELALRRGDVPVSDGSARYDLPGELVLVTQAGNVTSLATGVAAARWAP